MIDYLIINRDRHQGNIAFLRDADTLEIESAAPIFDSGSCKMLEAEATESLNDTKVNGLYLTDGELLKHVKNVSLLDINKLPSKDEIKDIFDKCINISDERKNKMLSLYEQKKDYIKQLQKEKKKALYKVSYRSRQIIEH